jgi:hypothetical protein
MGNQRMLNMKRVCALAVLIGFMAAAHSLHAQSSDASEPRVLSAFSKNSNHRNSMGLEEGICVTVANVGKLVDEARLQNKNIVLYMDHMPLNEVYPESYPSNAGKDDLYYFISHTEKPISFWDYLISSRKSGDFFTRKVSVSVGLEGGTEIETLVKDENSFTIILVKKSWFTISIIIIIALLILFLVLAIKSDILRDVGQRPEAGRKAYSLAQVQMGIWFFVIMTSWLLLYVVKHTFNTITETLVILMGISAGTGMGGVVIDANKGNAIRKSSGFLKDILSDEYGISFHRFQIMAWTVVMVAVFIRQVVSYLTMPEFDSSLLALMGISSGTYLGIKVTSKPNAQE